ncbi:MAG: (Fe-S)-binding protein [Thermoanaerobaculaceae bacterium]|jgi:Fe-S oxidoreductase|nr:(Fe-S)-binding protein [Thermoanaerobaculaceae bacterium]
MKPEPLVPPVKVRDIAKPTPALSPLDLQKIVPLPPPYDQIDPQTLWKELTAERRQEIDASLDGVSALSLKRPEDPQEEERLLKGFVEGLRKLLSVENNWTFLQPLQLTLDHCTHCQTCADACPIFVMSGRNEIYRPTYRADVLRRLVARYGNGGNPIKSALTGPIELNWETLARLAELSYRCTLCRRCAQACPIGVDNGLVTHELRKLFSQELGIAATECHANGSMLQLRVGSSTGMTPAVVRDNIEFIDEEMSEKVGFTVKTPFDKVGADVLLLHNAGEILAWPENPGAFAVILEAAGISWTMSSDLVAYDAINYGLWYDDVQFARVALEHIKVAKKLKVKKIVIGECGHAHKALTVIADRLLLGEDNIPRESALTFLEGIVNSGVLKLDPSRNDFPVTLHDPCNIVRAMGIVEPQRRILRRIAPRFREMTPHGVENYCCGGGSGFAIMSPNNFANWRMLVSGRIKMQQILEAFKDELDPAIPKYLCTPCSNCKGQFRDLLRAYGAWERSRILYGGLVELVVNAMADVPPGFLEWEFH